MITFTIGDLSYLRDLLNRDASKTQLAMESPHLQGGELRLLGMRQERDSELASRIGKVMFDDDKIIKVRRRP